jgi:hypothetical protein
MADPAPRVKPWYFKLHWQVVIALVLGVGFGWLAPGAATGIGFLGDLFLRLLKMIIIPLIFTSLVSGISSLGSARSVGRVGIRTMIYYTVSTTLAIIVGLILVNFIRPGDHLDFGRSEGLPEGIAATSQTLPDFLLRMVPDNIVAAMAAGRGAAGDRLRHPLRALPDQPQRPQCRGRKKGGGRSPRGHPGADAGDRQARAGGHLRAARARGCRAAGRRSSWKLRYYFMTVGWRSAHPRLRDPADDPAGARTALAAEYARHMRRLWPPPSPRPRRRPPCR